MPLIRSLVSKRRAYTIAVIFSLSEIMLMCSRCVKKKLVYIIIIAFSNRQPFFYIKCTKSNICLSCNVRSVSDAKCV